MTVRALAYSRLTTLPTASRSRCAHCVGPVSMPCARTSHCMHLPYLQTSFLADGGGWTARVEGKVVSGSSARRTQSLFVYVAVEDEYALDDTGARLQGTGELRVGDAVGGGDAHLEGDVAALGAFSLIARASHSAGQRPRTSVWGEVGDVHAYAAVRDRVLNELQEAQGAPRLSGKVAPGARLAVVQLDLVPPFTLDLIYVPGGCPASDCESELHERTASRLKERLEARQEVFSSRLRRTFNLDGKLLDGQPLQQACCLPLRPHPGTCKHTRCYPCPMLHRRQHAYCTPQSLTSPLQLTRP